MQKPEELVPPERREQMLKEMNQLIESFYWRAFKIGCHPFIEFCGVMGEYLKVAEQAHKEGIDFTNTTAHSGFPLPIQPYNARYLGEKLGCIYGPALQQPENRREFLQAIGLEEPNHGDPNYGDEPHDEVRPLELSPWALVRNTRASQRGKGPCPRGVERARPDRSQESLQARLANCAHS